MVLKHVSRLSLCICIVTLLAQGDAMINENGLEKAQDHFLPTAKSPGEDWGADHVGVSPQEPDLDVAESELRVLRRRPLRRPHQDEAAVDKLLERIKASQLVKNKPSSAADILKRRQKLGQKFKPLNKSRKRTLLPVDSEDIINVDKVEKLNDETTTAPVTTTVASTSSIASSSTSIEPTEPETTTATTEMTTTTFEALLFTPAATTPLVHPYTFESFPKLDSTIVPLTTEVEKEDITEEATTTEEAVDVNTTPSSNLIEIIYPSAEIATLPAHETSTTGSWESRSTDGAEELEDTPPTLPSTTTVGSTTTTTTTTTSRPSGISTTMPITKTTTRSTPDTTTSTLPSTTSSTTTTLASQAEANEDAELEKLIADALDAAQDTPKLKRKVQDAFVASPEDTLDDQVDHIKVEDPLTFLSNSTLPGAEWDNLDDAIIKSIEEVLEVDIPVDSKLLYRESSPRFTRDQVYHPQGQHGHEQDHPKQPYSFSYTIYDDNTKLTHSRAEAGDANGVVTGNYRVREDDPCTVRKVEYRADHEHGFDVLSIDRTPCEQVPDITGTSTFNPVAESANPPYFGPASTKHKQPRVSSPSSAVYSTPKPRKRVKKVRKYGIRKVPNSSTSLLHQHDVVSQLPPKAGVLGFVSNPQRQRRPTVAIDQPITPPITTDNYRAQDSFAAQDVHHHHHDDHQEYPEPLIPGTENSGPILPSIAPQTTYGAPQQPPLGPEGTFGFGQSDFLQPVRSHANRNQPPPSGYGVPLGQPVQPPTSYGVPQGQPQTSYDIDSEGVQPPTGYGIPLASPIQNNAIPITKPVTGYGVPQANPIHGTLSQPPPSSYGVPQAELQEENYQSQPAPVSYGVPLAEPVEAPQPVPQSDPQPPPVSYGVPLAEPVEAPQPVPQSDPHPPPVSYGVPLAEPVEAPQLVPSSYGVPQSDPQLPPVSYGVPLADPVEDAQPPPSSYGVAQSEPVINYGVPSAAEVGTSYNVVHNPPELSGGTSGTFHLSGPVNIDSSHVGTPTLFGFSVTEAPISEPKPFVTTPSPASPRPRPRPRPRKPLFSETSLSDEGAYDPFDFQHSQETESEESVEEAPRRPRQNLRANFINFDEVSEDDLTGSFQRQIPSIEKPLIVKKKKKPQTTTQVRRNMLMNIVLRPGGGDKAKALPRPRVEVTSEGANVIIIRMTFPKNENIHGLRAFTPEDLEQSLLENEAEIEVEAGDLVTSGSEAQQVREVVVAEATEAAPLSTPKLEMFTQDEVMKQKPPPAPRVELPPHPPLGLQPHLVRLKGSRPVVRSPFHPSVPFPVSRVPKSVFHPVRRQARRHRRRWGGRIRRPRFHL